MTQCPYYTDQKCNHSRCNDTFCIRRTKLDELYRASSLSENQKVRIVLNLDDDGTDLNEFRQLAEIERNINTFVENGYNLYLHSANTGNSKTSWAVRMIQAYLANNWAKLDLSCHVLFISIPSYLVALKRNMNTPDEYAMFINKNVYDAELVVWDDIGTKFASEYDMEQLFNILNRRIQNGKSNIFTSNLSDQELVTALGPRLASRISQDSINIELHGADKRNLKYKNFFDTNNTTDGGNKND